MGPAGPPGEQGDPGPFCPPGYVLAEVQLHQRSPIDQDLAVVVCVVG